MRCTTEGACDFDTLRAILDMRIPRDNLISWGIGENHRGSGKSPGGRGKGITAAPRLDVKASSHRLRSEITMEGNSWDSLAKLAHTNGRILCVISLEFKITEKWNTRSC